jgi:hypothetical protein
MGLQETRWGGMYWVHLAYNRDRWQALVNVAVDYQVL